MISRHYFTLKKHSGIGLIELMMSMLIGVFIMAGVVQMFSTSTQNAIASAGTSRIQENIRYSFSRIQRDISQSGNLGCISTSNIMHNNNPFLDNLLALDSAVGQSNDFSSIINGDANANAATAPAGDVASGTDTFRIRYVNHSFKIGLAADVDSGDSSITIDNMDTDYARLQQYQTVAVTNCSKGGVFMITNVPAGSGGVINFATGVVSPVGAINQGQSNVKSNIDASEVFGVINGSKGVTSPTYLYGGDTGSYLYFIGTAAAAGGPCDTANAAHSNANCALFRRDTGDSQELVQGVHDLQVFYGWTDLNGQFFSARANDANIDWDRVDRARVVMSFNSIDSATFTGNAIDTGEAGLLNKTVTRVFNLSNQL